MFFCFSLFSKPLFFQYSISPLFCQFYTSMSCEPFCDRRLAHPAALACHLRLSDDAAAAPVYRIPLRLFVWLFVCLVRTLWARAAAASVVHGVPARGHLDDVSRSRAPGSDGCDATAGGAVEEPAGG